MPPAQVHIEQDYNDLKVGESGKSALEKKCLLPCETKTKSAEFCLVEYASIKVLVISRNFSRSQK